MAETGKTKNFPAYRHRHIDIDILEKKRKKERRVYIPETFEPTMQNLEEILRREGRSVSEWFRDNAERYVLIHAEGNPQLRLDKFAVDLNAKKTCFFCQGHFKILKKVEFISGLVAPTCDVCLEQKKASRTVKRILGITK